MIVKNISAHEFKSQVKNFRLPLLATAIFIMLAASLIWLRLHERNVLSELFSRNKAQGQNYAALLSRDRTDEFVKNKTKNDSQGGSSIRGNQSASTPSTETSTTDNANPATVTSSSPPTTTSPQPSVVVSPSNPTSPTPPPPPPPPPSITSFNAKFYLFQHSTTMPVTCDGGSTSNNCYRIYRFDAVIHYTSGPGTVKYTWRNSKTGDKNESFVAGAGEDYIHVFTETQISCNLPGSFTAQALITSPNAESSDIVTLNHAC